MASTKKKNRNTDSTFSRLVQGRWISTAFFSKNALFILFGLFSLMVYISNKYECQTKMETIQRLEKDLEIVKTESVRERSEYMSRTRESSIKELVDTLRLGLDVQEQPPFIITYSR